MLIWKNILLKQANPIQYLFFNKNLWKMSFRAFLVETKQTEADRAFTSKFSVFISGERQILKKNGLQ